MPPAHVMACKGPLLRRIWFHNGTGHSGHPLGTTAPRHRGKAPPAALGWPGLRPAVRARWRWHPVPKLVGTHLPMVSNAHGSHQ